LSAADYTFFQSAGNKIIGGAILIPLKEKPATH
jgi:hypothetical protein